MNRLCTAVLTLVLAAGMVVPGTALADDPEAPSDSTDAVELRDRNDTGLDATSVKQDEPTLDVSVNGSLRFNALFRDYGKPSEGPTINNELQDGGFTFDTFRIGANGSYGDLLFDFEWAFYPSSFGGNYIHHGWVGYQFSDARQIQVGVSQVPFGIQPYASSSWFFNTTYYVGLEDDYDAGIKALYQANGWDIQGAYYMNAEQTDFFAGSNFGRYSYDVVPVSGFPEFGEDGDANDVTGVSGYQVVPGEYEDEDGNPVNPNSIRSPIAEAHQFNIKVARTFDHGDLGFTKVGVSGQRGQLENLSTGDTDWHAAYAGHLHGRYGGLGLKLEVAQQELNPPLTDAEQTRFANHSGVGYDADDFVVMGAYNFPQRVAAEHTVYSSSVSYRIPVDAGPISQVKPYYDFSAVTKNIDGWNDNATHDIGFLTTAGPLFVYTDLNISKGHPFNHPGANFASVMAENNDNEWRTAFNVNIGLYF